LNLPKSFEKIILHPISDCSVCLLQIFFRDYSSSAENNKESTNQIITEIVNTASENIVQYKRLAPQNRL
jgi:hypothetical protein